MKVVVINGIAGAGKDLFVTFCTHYLGTEKVKNYSTVDYVKQVAAYIGWDGTKDDKSRTFLSELKRIMTEYADIPYLRTCFEIEKFRSQMREKGKDYLENSVIFIHCREPKEIARFVEDFDAETLLIRRESAESIQLSNKSDNSVFDYPYDFVIRNDGTIEQLRAVAAEYVREILELNI